MSLSAGADGHDMPPVTPTGLRPGLAIAVIAALLALPAGATGATTGGTQYGQASQAPVPAPGPAPYTGGIDPSQPLPAPAPGTPVAPPRPDQVARVTAGGLAVAPAGAPLVVQQLIAAGNRIALAKYLWGGGHQRWEDRGYDCSGSVSYALHGAGLLDAPLVSGELAGFGAAGPGQWVTIYANAGHVYLAVAGLRFDTSGQRQAGTRWQPLRRSSRGFRVRHPVGL